MIGIVILGAGGHGREVAEIVRQQCDGDRSTELLGFVDEDSAVWGDTRDGFQILGGWSWFDDRDRAALQVVCAAGAPATRRHFARKASDLNLRFARVVSPLATVSPHAHMGEGITIFPHVVVSTGANVGDHVILNSAATVSHDCDLGAYSFIAPGVHVAGGVRIGKGCWIGIGANIIQGLSIGSGTIVGAGAAVVHDLPANVTAVGVPARIVARRGEADA